MEYKGKTIAVSGGFDPVHVGHLSLFEAAKALVGDTGKLVVFVNSDAFLVEKKGRAFMSLPDRVRLIRALRVVDEVYPVVDEDMTVCRTLEKYRPDLFANGGDRTKDNTPEGAVCRTLGIEMVFSVGGEKERSSSELLADYNKSS